MKGDEECAVILSAVDRGNRSHTLLEETIRFDFLWTAIQMQGFPIPIK